MTDINRQRSTALSRCLAEIADGSLAARLRLEQAARVIATARRAADLAETGALRLPGGADAGRSGGERDRPPLGRRRHHRARICRDAARGRGRAPAARRAGLGAALRAGGPDRLAA